MLNIIMPPKNQIEISSDVHPDGAVFDINCFTPNVTATAADKVLIIKPI